MKSKLIKLSNWLRFAGYPLTAQNINELYKTGSVSSLRSLGYPPEVAKIIHSKIPEKWVYIVAKWWLQSFEFEKFPEEPPPNWLSRYSDRWRANIISIELVKNLLQLSDEQKITAYADKKYETLKSYIYDKFKIDESKESIWIPGPYSSSTMDEQLSWLFREFTEDFTKELNLFLKSDFFTDLMDEKTFNKQQCKNFNYADAMNTYIETIKIKTMPVVLDLGNYRWVNAGKGFSSFVERKMKNCGRGTWGGLRALNSGDNEMLLLMDSSNNPHVIVTWNPGFIESENAEPKRYFGQAEGIGSTQIKKEYMEYVKALFEFLNPNLTNLDSRNLAQELGASSNGYSEYPPKVYSKEEKSKLWF